MEEERQADHWHKAQSLELGLDLIAAARSQLRMLAAVDSHPLGLYSGPAIDNAISRYENQWLPLLAEYGPHNSSGLPLIPPLDCAWVWHCHRLNPVQYIKDCKAVYGKLLDPPAESTGVENDSIAYTRQLWDLQFPNENYEFPLEEFLPKRIVGPRKFTYDLWAAVERQSSFFYQVSRPHVEDERYLYAALQRYKGFLYLLKLSNLAIFLVPTYDIDLMWHSHQACSGVYRDDMVKLLGRVLSHDDTDSDRAEGQKLDTGFNRTRELWHHTFGSSYEKAGAMYRGEPPRSPSLIQWTPGIQCWPKSQPTRTSFEPIQGVKPRKTIQVCIGVFEARNLHINHDGVVAVRLLFKRKCSMLKLETSWLKWADNTKWNKLWSFDCEESTEGLRLELHLESKRGCGPIKKSGLIGWTDILWKTLLNSSTLSFNGWMPLVMRSYVERDKKPTCLKVCISITPPSAAPYLFQMDHPLLKNKGRNSLSKLVYDHRLQKSFVAEFKDSLVGETWQPSLIQVYGVDPDKSCGNLLGSAACVGAAMTMWSLLDGDMRLSISSTWKTHPPSIQLITASTDSAMLLHGRKYQYEVPVSRQIDEAGYMTLVRRGQGALAGKATALFNWKSGAMEISPDESGVLVILLCAIMAMVDDKSHFMFCNRKPLHKLKGANNQDEWGAVMLNNRGEVHGKDLLWFCPWYTVSSKTWVGNLYKADRGFSSLFKLCCGFGSSGGCEGCGECLNGKSKRFDCFLEKPKHETVHGEHCTGWSEVNHEGCSTVRHVHSIMNAGKKMVVHGGQCGACGAGGCGACGAGGCGNSRSKANVVAHAGGCGACGAGGCGNDINKSNLVAHAGGCGACGAGGCGNDINKSNVVVHASGCGSCGAGECGNKISKANVVAGGCGACGAGGCGNNVSKANAVAGGCGACGAGGCGNSVECQTPTS